MAPRDPAKTALNRRIKALTDELKALETQVLRDTGFDNLHSLNATIGGKAQEFIDLHHQVILSPDAYRQAYNSGFKAAMSPPGTWPNNHRRNFERLRRSKASKRYYNLFLERSYFKHAAELSRTRPRLEESEVWVGQKNAEWGLLITPRWNLVKEDWENDRSEIRHFPKLYWTIGHVLESGLVPPGENDRMSFASVDAYLTFFRTVLVRASGSKYEKGIAKRYVDFVKSAPDPESVPLLVPEFRYEGRTGKHKYRLDFTIIDPFTMRKVGYELSPWSTHGEMTGLAGKSQKEINEIAKSNFEKEMSKHKAFFKKHDIYSLIYTDVDLTDLDAVFEDMKTYLEPSQNVFQAKLDLVDNFLD